MKFLEWFKNKILNEGLGTRLPDYLQKTISKLTPHNPFLYIVIPNKINTGIFELTGRELADLHRDTVGRATSLVERAKNMRSSFS